MAQSIGTIVGGAIGSKKAKGFQNEEAQYLRDALSAIQQIEVPEIADQQLNYILPELVGELTPEMLQALEQQGTALENIEIDPRLKDAQMSALDYYSQVGEMGLTPAERSARNEIVRSQANQANADRATALQNAAQRGIAGSGVELAAQLAGAQNASQRADSASDQLIAEAFNRSLQAQGSKADLAGTMRTQEYGQASDLARAKDLINQYNTQQQVDTQTANVAARNAAAKQNLNERQRIADQTVNSKNNQQVANKDLIQQKFSNEMLKGNAMQNSMNNLSKSAGVKAANIATKYTNIGAGLGQGVDQGVSMLMKSDSTQKKNINPTKGKMKDLLDKLESYSFEYDEPEKNGEGLHAGVLAQDVEKAGPIGKSMVIDTPEGKMLDVKKSLSSMLASQVELNKRLNKLEDK